MNELCGCCEGIEQLTSITIVNRPGLDALVYRAGTHASFLETMLARLSARDFPELRGLTIRTPDDPSIALLDAWATVADVLTFYQERIANEGYLHTATERHSILELARLVGYKLRPGVAASVYLAYTLEKDHDVTILPGNRAQSVPGPGELPQSFETAETLEARFAWNVLKPRLTRPQLILKKDDGLAALSANDDGAIYVSSTATNLKLGDSLLFVFGSGDNQQVFVKVASVETQTAENRTKVTVLPKPLPVGSNPARMALMSNGHVAATKIPIGVTYGKLVRSLARPAVLQPFSSQRLERRVADIFGKQSDIQQQLLVNFSPGLQQTLYAALGNTQVTQSEPLRNVQALRVRAAPFGHNAPLKTILDPRRPGVVIDYQEWPINGTTTVSVRLTLAEDQTATADLSIKQGAQTWNQQVKLEKDKKEVDVPAAPETPRVHITVTVGGTEFPFVNGGVFNFLDVDEKIHLTLGSAAGDWNIQVEPEKMGKVSAGQHQHFSSDQHTIDINNPGGNVIFVSDEANLLPNPKILPLDAQYDKIIPESWVVVERPDKKIISQVQSVQTVSIAAYGITGRVTQLTLYKDWLEPSYRLLSDIRGITVYAQSEKLEQAEAPIEEDIGETTVQTASAMTSSVPTGTDTIELDRLYDGLKPGRWIIISGERTDIIQADGKTPVRGIMRSELAMIASATQKVQQIEINGQKRDLPGDKIHTFLHLARKLDSSYRRDTVIIYGNVVRATHGETRTEVLGSGDGSKSLQRFTLRQSPLTYLSVPTAAGAASTLQVRINDILWHEADSLAGSGPTDRSYTTETDDADKTAVIFGNGQYGARLPTGVENVKAVYRTGIGKPGNVKAEQISLLATKPLGVKSVINPLRASGGADRESRDQARRNIPVALLALDRLVSVQDYADFARTYAGISKSSAVRLSDGRRQLVHLTIVGADNIPIDESSDLFENLFQSLRQFGDPNEPLAMVLAEVMFIVISAKVRLLPDYALESVEPKIRTALLDFFSFERRELGQPVFQSEVFSVIQSVPGVDYVDLEVMSAVDENTVIQALDSQQPAGLITRLGLTPPPPPFIDVKLAQVNQVATDPAKRIIPAQMAFLNPDLPDTLILTELPK